MQTALFSVRRAAALLGINKQELRKKLDDGEIKGERRKVRNKEKWYIPDLELNKLMEQVAASGMEPAERVDVQGLAEFFEQPEETAIVSHPVPAGENAKHAESIPPTTREPASEEPAAVRSVAPGAIQAAAIEAPAVKAPAVKAPALEIPAVQVQAVQVPALASAPVQAAAVQALSAESARVQAAPNSSATLPQNVVSEAFADNLVGNSRVDETAPDWLVSKSEEKDTESEKANQTFTQSQVSEPVNAKKAPSQNVVAEAFNQNSTPSTFAKVDTQPATPNVVADALLSTTAKPLSPAAKNPIKPTAPSGSAKPAHVLTEKNELAIEQLKAEIKSYKQSPAKSETPSNSEFAAKLKSPSKPKTATQSDAITKSQTAAKLERPTHAESQIRHIRLKLATEAEIRAKLKRPQPRNVSMEAPFADLDFVPDFEPNPFKENLPEPNSIIADEFLEKVLDQQIIPTAEAMAAALLSRSILDASVPTNKAWFAERHGAADYIERGYSVSQDAEFKHGIARGIGIGSAVQEPMTYTAAIERASMQSSRTGSQPQSQVPNQSQTQTRTRSQTQLNQIVQARDYARSTGALLPPDFVHESGLATLDDVIHSLTVEFAYRLAEERQLIHRLELDLTEQSMIAKKVGPLERSLQEEVRNGCIKDIKIRNLEAELALLTKFTEEQNFGWTSDYSLWLTVALSLLYTTWYFIAH